MSDGVDRGSAFGRWLTADRAAVDALLAGALARGGDRDAVRAAVVAVAGAFAGGRRARPGPRAGARGPVADLAARGRWRADGPDRAVVLDVLPRLTGRVRSRPRRPSTLSPRRGTDRGAHR